MRIGFGVDVHAFGGDKPLVIGGVHIPHSVGLLAHSDGDVLLHALCDAILGALALGDIGQHFPDTDPQWKGVDSRVLLKAVNEMAAAHGYQLGNADMTLVAEVPKFAPHTARIRANIADDLAVSLKDISVKATTSEKLGFTGRREGIAAYASVLLTPTAR